jgi:hypothetical protein
MKHHSQNSSLEGDESFFATFRPRLVTSAPTVRVFPLCVNPRPASSRANAQFKNEQTASCGLFSSIFFQPLLTTPESNPPAPAGLPFFANPDIPQAHVRHGTSTVRRGSGPSMTLSTFSFPTTTIFGPGAIKELPQRLRGLRIHRPLVVTDPGLLHTDAFAALQETLGKAQRDKEWFVFSSVHPNPIEQDVVRGAEEYRRAQCDGVIAFGGGSALDAGKAVRLLLKKPSLNLAEFDWKDDWYGLAPCVAIPTTAGTGSEVGRSSVIILEKTQKKSVLFHPGLLANLVLLDPELTRGLPAKLTAATGADALTHAIESFTSPVFHPLCDGIALEAIHIIVEALPRASMSPPSR